MSSSGTVAAALSFHDAPRRRRFTGELLSCVCEGIGGSAHAGSEAPSTSFALKPPVTDAVSNSGAFASGIATENRASSAASCIAVCGRRPGSFSRHDITSVASAECLNSCGATSSSCFGICAACCEMNCVSVGPSKGSLPDSMRYATTPNE